MPETDVVFASAFVATFDRSARSMIYASAGHDVAMIMGKGTHGHLTTTGPLIGVSADPLFGERNEPLGAGDLLVLVTDGVTECRDEHAKRIPFGTSGVVRAVASARTSSSRSVRDSIARSLDEFSGGYYRDDATIAVIGAR